MEFETALSFRLDVISPEDQVMIKSIDTLTGSQRELFNYVRSRLQHHLKSQSPCGNQTKPSSLFSLALSSRHHSDWANTVDWVLLTEDLTGD